MDAANRPPILNEKYIGQIDTKELLKYQRDADAEYYEARIKEACDKLSKRFNSDPPSPERVCPKCGGSGKITSRYKEADHKCETCNGTGKVSSPEPPEKVMDLLLTLDEISRLPFYATGTIAHSPKEICQAQILKLQQAGWGSNSELRDECARWEMLVNTKEGRIKELERINRVLEQQLTLENKPIDEAKAEARQQACKTIGNYIIDKCYWDENVKAFAVNEQFIENLKQGELPKE